MAVQEFRRINKLGVLISSGQLKRNVQKLSPALPESAHEHSLCPLFFSWIISLICLINEKKYDFHN
jgi:hypothetical protein